MMKKYLHTVLAAGCVALLMLASCKKDENKLVADPANAKGGTLAASASTIVLTKATETTTAVTFTITQPSFGFPAAPTNTLQFDVSGDNFTSPKEVVLAAKASTLAYAGLDFNALALSLNMKTGVAAPLQVRIKSQISTTITAVYSNVITLTVTPYPLVSYVYVPGAYQTWNPATADSLKSATGNGVYTGVINFVGTDFGFKITTGKNWNVAYGDAGSGAVSTTASGNLTAPGVGDYQLILDENKNTLAMKAYQISIIGDGAQGWNAGNDVDMTFNNGTQTWSATTTLSSAGTIKFRLNHAWDVSYGGSGGVASTSAGNIPVAASGTYLVTFSEATLTYTLTKQ
jgi:hypothetical protein